MAIVIRLGSPADVEVAVSVYERSNLARRQGVWPEQASRTKHVAARLREPSLLAPPVLAGRWPAAHAHNARTSGRTR